MLQDEDGGCEERIGTAEENTVKAQCFSPMSSLGAEVFVLFSKENSLKFPKIFYYLEILGNA